MSYSEQLERETEQTRTQLADTLDELRACMSPGQVVNQIADYARDGAGAAFASNLRHQAINNPLPVALIGAGVAWLMLGARANGGVAAANRAGRAASGAASKAKDATAAAGEAVSETAAGISSTASEVAQDARARARSSADAIGDSAMKASDRLGDMAESGSESIKRTTLKAYDTVADGARRTAATMTDSTKSLGRRTLATSGSFLAFCREQPLVLTGIGIALGAAVGALLPRTDAEDRLMGETSDAVKDRVQDVASEPLAQVNEAVGEQPTHAAHEATLVPSPTEEDNRAQGPAPADDSGADGKAPMERGDVGR
jgi:hypothetical protein